MNPYHAVVRSRLRGIVAAINRGDFAHVVASFAPDAEHRFAGSGHALSGARHDHAAIAAWYARLGRLFPGLRFAPRGMAVSGGPADTRAFVAVDESSVDPEGTVLSNDVVLEIRLRWGRATALRGHCDTARLERNLAHVAARGVDEATAAPIES